MKGFLYFGFIFVIFSALYHFYKADSLADDEEDPFIPTHDWQIVKPGQRVPPGLHIRVNFETGVTEAKILEDKDKGSSNLIPVHDGNVAEIIQDTQAPGKTLGLKQTIEEALKNIKSDEPLAEPKKKTDFRSYEDLKKDFEELNLNPTTESEIVKQLIQRYKDVYKAKDVDELQVLTIFEDLEYLVHQYDTALDFIKMDGFREIVYKSMNSSNVHVRMDALKLFGSSLQNNVKVQIHALETGGLDILLRILVLENDKFVKNRALFSLGALLRRFPLAQIKFLEKGGLTVFSKLFETKDVRLQIKLSTLISDLLIEHNEALEDTSAPDHKEKVKQYTRVSLKSKIAEKNFCKYLSDLLNNILAIDSNDFDALEKCLKTIQLVVDDCSSSLSVGISDSLLKLMEQFKKLSFDEKLKNEEYFHNLHSLVLSIASQLSVQYKSEL